MTFYHLCPICDRSMRSGAAIVAHLWGCWAAPTSGHIRPVPRKRASELTRREIEHFTRLGEQMTRDKLDLLGGLQGPGYRF